MSQYWNLPDDGLGISDNLHNLLTQGGEAETLQDGLFPDADAFPFDTAVYDEAQLDWEEYPPAEFEPDNWFEAGGLNPQMDAGSTVEQVVMQHVRGISSSVGKNELTRRNMEEHHWKTVADDISTGLSFSKAENPVSRWLKDNQQDVSLGKRLGEGFCLKLRTPQERTVQFPQFEYEVVGFLDDGSFDWARTIVTYDPLGYIFLPNQDRDNGPPILKPFYAPKSIGRITPLGLSQSILFVSQIGYLSPTKTPDGEEHSLGSIQISPTYIAPFFTSNNLDVAAYFTIRSFRNGTAIWIIKPEADVHVREVVDWNPDIHPPHRYEATYRKRQRSLSNQTISKEEPRKTRREFANQYNQDVPGGTACFPSAEINWDTLAGDIDWDTLLTGAVAAVEAAAMDMGNTAAEEKGDGSEAGGDEDDSKPKEGEGKPKKKKKPRWTPAEIQQFKLHKADIIHFKKELMIFFRRDVHAPAVKGKLPTMPDILGGDLSVEDKTTELLDKVLIKLTIDKATFPVFLRNCIIYFCGLSIPKFCDECKQTTRIYTEGLVKFGGYGVCRVTLSDVEQFNLANKLLENKNYLYDGGVNRTPGALIYSHLALWKLTYSLFYGDVSVEADPDSTGGRTVAACVNRPELLTPFSEMGAATSGSLIRDELQHCVDWYLRKYTGVRIDSPRHPCRVPLYIDIVLTRNASRARLWLKWLLKPKVSEACHRIAGKKGERKATGNRRKAVSKQLVLG